MLSSRWYNVSVVFLWLATMGWLIVAKVLPDWLIGTPPDYQRIVEAQRTEPTVGWMLACEGKPLGWALSETHPSVEGPVEIESCVRLDAGALFTGGQGAMGELLRNVIPRHLYLDTQSIVRIDGLGNLMEFDSSLYYQRERWVRLRGVVEGAQVQLTVTGSKLPQPIERIVPLPPKAVMGDILSPQTHLPGLREGQTWTVPVYNPLQPHQGMEILHAVVEGREPISWGGQNLLAWLVVYRADDGLGTGRERARGRLWVRDDGAVLRQEMRLFDMVLTFRRMDADETRECVQRKQELGLPRR